MEGEFGRALKEFERAQQMDEHNPLFGYWSAKSLSYAQSLGEALTLFDFIEKESPGTIWANLGTFRKYALENKKPEAVQVANEIRPISCQPPWRAALPEAHGGD